MLADLFITGYIAPNIVKDSTKSAQPMYFLSPWQRGGAQAFTGPEHGGVGRRRLPLEPAVNETFRFSETKTNRFRYRDNEQTR
jgi:hypothetical protein